MNKHLKYLNYLIRHKYFVFVAGLQLKVSLWRLIIHDWSKFLPCEWIPYVANFYGDRVDKEKYGISFDYSWLHHIHWNKHHFQHWTLIEDSGAIKPLRMPEKYVREMASDWLGAGRAITGKWEAWDYYQKNKDNTLLHPETRKLFESLLKNFKKP